jgi:ribonuclease T1
MHEGAVFARALLLAIALALLAAGAWARGESSGLPTISAKELPPEALHTIRLIHQGGPFRYGRDGVVFRNFEQLLPPRKRGYYREYTVPTPGLRHRGARRIVAGLGGELYYTDDHYRSFRRVLLE